MPILIPGTEPPAVNSEKPQFGVETQFLTLCHHNYVYSNGFSIRSARPWATGLGSDLDFCREKTSRNFQAASLFLLVLVLFCFCFITQNSLIFFILPVASPPGGHDLVAHPSLGNDVCVCVCFFLCPCFRNGVSPNKRTMAPVYGHFSTVMP